MIADYLMVSPVYLMGMTDEMEVLPVEASRHTPTTKREQLLELAINQLKCLDENKLRKILKFMEEFL